MHRLFYVHSSFVRSVVVSYIFLCTPGNSTMQYLFHWLFLHSDSGITENMFHFCNTRPVVFLLNLGLCSVSPFMISCWPHVTTLQVKVLIFVDTTPFILC